MKKLSIFCSALLLMGMVACDDSSDLGVAQSNPQQNVLTLGGITIDPQGIFAGRTADLNSYEGRELPVLKYSSVDALPEGTTVRFDLEVADNMSYTNADVITLTPGEVYTVSEAALSQAIYDFYGKAPLERDVYVRVAGYLLNGNECNKIQDANLGEWFMAKEMNITPADPHLDIEATYYLVSSIDNFAFGEPMTHTDKHQYDDPVFSAVISVTDTDLANGPVKWYIVPESAKASGNVANYYGQGETANAMLKGGPAFEFTSPARYQIFVDMETLTVKRQYANDFLYFWIAGSKWGTNFRLSTNDYIEYEGVANPTNTWCLTGEQNLNSLVVVAGTAEDSSLTEGSISFGKAASLYFKKYGFFYYHVNLSEMTFKATEIESLGLVGGMTNWGNKNDDGTVTPDIALQPVNNEKTKWEATMTITTDTQWKIRANSAWDLANWGALEGGDGEHTQGDLRKDGANFSAAPGTYKVTVDFGTGDKPYNVTVVAI